MKAEIGEIFESVQGEGIFVGVRQLFIRFARCNLRCWYCDTKSMMNNRVCMDLVNNRELENPVEIDYVSKIMNANIKIHSIAFTGGEPLLYADFIKELPKAKPLYLESNMTLPEEAKKLKFVDFVAGDLKIRESGNEPYNEIIERTIRSFRVLRNTKNRVTFCKIVLPEKFDVGEIISIAESVKDYVCCFVLQPVFGAKLDAILDFQKKMMKVKDTRLIPQVHKYLGVK